MASLEGWSSTIELHPQKRESIYYIQAVPVKGQARLFVIFYGKQLERGEMQSKAAFSCNQHVTPESSLRDEGGIMLL